MTQRFANNAYGSLVAEANAVTTTLTLGAGQGMRFPLPSAGDYFLLTLVGLDGNGNEASWEIVKVTARSSDTLTVERAQEGTTAAVWSVGTRAELRITSGTLLSFTDATEAAAAAPVQSVAGRAGAVTLTKSDVGLSKVENKSSATIRSELTSSDVTTALGFTPEDAANKGAANGYVPLGADSKIASTYLPSYVDDVLEYANLAALPGTGVVGVIYVTLDTNKVYRWSGSAYTEISPSPGSTDAVPEGATNLYFTNARAQAALAGMYLPSTGGSLAGNLDFSGAARRITGDFTNGTIANRVFVQTSTTNSATYFGLLPNGTAVNTQFQVYGSSDPANAPVGSLIVNASSVRLQSAATGAGTTLPLTLYVNTTEVARASTAYNLLVGTATDDGTHKLQVAGALGVLGADATVLTRLRAATGMVRVRPYMDATNGAMIDSTNAAESAYLPLTLQGSAVRLLGSSGSGLTVDTSGNVTISGNLEITSGKKIIFEVYSSKTISSNTTLVANTEYETGSNLRVNHTVSLVIPASTKLIVREYAAGLSL